MTACVLLGVASGTGSALVLSLYGCSHGYQEILGQACTSHLSDEQQLFLFFPKIREGHLWSLKHGGWPSPEHGQLGSAHCAQH